MRCRLVCVNFNPDRSTGACATWYKWSILLNCMGHREKWRGNKITANSWPVSGHQACGGQSVFRTVDWLMNEIVSCLACMDLLSIKQQVWEGDVAQPRPLSLYVDIGMKLLINIQVWVSQPKEHLTNHSRHSFPRCRGAKAKKRVR